MTGVIASRFCVFYARAHALGQAFNLPRIRVQMLWGVVVRDPYEGGVPSPPRRDRWIAAILFDRDPFFGSCGLCVSPPYAHGGGTDHGCTAPQVRVACQRSGCTLASATMGWARPGAVMTITPLPAGNISMIFIQKGTDYGCALASDRMSFARMRQSECTITLANEWGLPNVAASRG